MGNDSYPIILNKSNYVENSNNTFQITLPKNVNFDKFDIGLDSISIPYSWKNITSNLKNNKFIILFPHTTPGVSWIYTCTLPDGVYDVDGLNLVLKNFFIKNGLYMINNQTLEITTWARFENNNPLYGITYIADPTPTSAPSGYTMASNYPGFSPDTRAPRLRLLTADGVFNSMIGFAAGDFPSSASLVQVKIDSTLLPKIKIKESVLMLCDVISNKYTNINNIIHNFDSNNVSVGSIIESSPSSVSFINCQASKTKKITISFVNQDFQTINIYDKNLTIKLLLREL
jgi:hypothetical protein